jgi:pimeloyl-ACP methyl ester carboxylesterase
VVDRPLSVLEVPDPLPGAALWGTVLAADHPERVDRVAYIGPAVGLAPGHPEREVHPFDASLASDEQWAKYNAQYWRRAYGDFVAFFFGQCFNEPHSTKPIEDCIGWALETTPQTLIDATLGIDIRRGGRFRDTCARVRCPTLVIHGGQDLIRPLAEGTRSPRPSAGGS